MNLYSLLSKLMYIHELITTSWLVTSALLLAR